MRYQLPRFLLFLLFLFLSVAALFFWKSFHEKSPSLRIQEQVAIPRQHHLLGEGKIFPAFNNLSLQALNEEMTNLVAHTVPSVVSIITTNQPNNDALLREFFGLSDHSPPSTNKVGSGIIVSKKGFIITNWHVVKDATQVIVEINDGRSFPAALLGFDERTDIAILKIDADGLSPIILGDSDQVEVGQTVMAIGNPFGLDETVTQGIISAKRHRMLSEVTHEFFQTSALINPGNSGGPLVNIYGEVIGINNFIISHGGGAEGVAFAIPSNVARRVYNNIMQYGHTVRPWFGVILKPLNQRLAHQLALQNSTGAMIVATLPNSPAALAHIEPGDIITSFNNHPVKDWIDLRNYIAETKVGSTIPVTVQRAGHPLTLSVNIREEPAQ